MFTADLRRPSLSGTAFQNKTPYGRQFCFLSILVLALTATGLAEPATTPTKLVDSVKPAETPAKMAGETKTGSVDDLMVGLIPSSLIHLGNGAYFSDYGLVVNKKARVLTVWKNENGKIQKIKEYPSDIGKNAGVKVARDDAKTPEGIYFFQKMIEGRALDSSQYGKRAFTTNYPNLFDLREGKTGAGIWLHAIPETKTLQRGSRGCVVVRNESILDVSPFIQLHTTPFVIL